MEKKITTSLVIALLFTLVGNGQTLNPNQIKKIESFGINYNLLTTENQNIETDFLEIIKKEQKRKKNKTLGYIFGSLGVLTTTSGILVLSKVDNNNTQDNLNEGDALLTVFGGIVAAVGAIELGVSIPFFVSSKKRKKERNALILKLNPNFEN
ncbi:MAG: hypothetical protein ACK5NB_10520 [Flavobacteriaceae bacterium]